MICRIEHLFSLLFSSLLPSCLLFPGPSGSIQMIRLLRGPLGGYPPRGPGCWCPGWCRIAAAMAFSPSASSVLSPSESSFAVSGSAVGRFSAFPGLWQAIQALAVRPEGRNRSRRTGVWGLKDSHVLIRSGERGPVAGSLTWAEGKPGGWWRRAGRGFLPDTSFSEEIRCLSSCRFSDWIEF